MWEQPQHWELAKGQRSDHQSHWMMVHHPITCNSSCITTSHGLSVIHSLFRTLIMKVTSWFHSVTSSTNPDHMSEKCIVQLFWAYPSTCKMESYLNGVSVCMQSSPTRMEGRRQQQGWGGGGEGERKRKVLVSLHKITYLSFSEERILISVK